MKRPCNAAPLEIASHHGAQTQAVSGVGDGFVTYLAAQRLDLGE
jgi:hypothetical protein